MFKPSPSGGAFRQPGRRILAAAAAIGASFIVNLGAAAQAPQSDAVDALHAAFLFNFAKFTTWPAVNDLDITIKFCVQGDTIGQNAFSGWGKKRIQNRPVRVAFLQQFSASELANCSILFLREEPQGMDLETLQELANRHNTLLVSDIEGFSAAGGHIELYEQNRRLRFKVNLGALEKADLTLGAGVLNLAEIVSTSGVSK